MQFVTGEADNPEQRVAEDMPEFIASTLKSRHWRNARRGDLDLVRRNSLGLSGTLTCKSSSRILSDWIVIRLTRSIFRSLSSHLLRRELRFVTSTG